MAAFPVKASPFRQAIDAWAGKQAGDKARLACAKYAGTLTEVLNSDAPETTALGKTAFQHLKQDMPHNRLQQLWLCLNIYVGEDKAKAQETFPRDHWLVLNTKPEVTEMKEHP